MFKYIKLGKILKEVIQGGKQLKTALYNSKEIKSTQIPMAYSLLSLVVNNFDAIKQAQQQISAKTKTSITNYYLMIIMIAEFINTGKIVGGGQLKKIIIEHQHLIPDIQKQSKINKQTVQIRLRAVDDNAAILEEKMSKIGVKDVFLPNLYHLEQQIYSDLTKDRDFNILHSSACVMQSFSSALPPFLLLKGVQNKWKRRRYDIIDACSAPGNKTIQLAEYNNKGKIFAFEKNYKRFQLLNSTIEKYQVTNIIAKNQDFLQVANRSKYKKVKFIMLDPSCSGSGMLTNFTRDKSVASDDDAESFEQFCDKRYNQLSESEKKRIQNLHNFQLELLNHASKLQPLRLSYSTCSIYKRQNQEVVQAFITSHPQYQIKPYNIENIELLTPGFGKLFKNCLRVDPRKMKTDGFFVTVFTKNRNCKN